MTWNGPLEPAGEGVFEIPASYKGRNGDLEMRVPGRIVCDDVLLPHIQDDEAPEQVANVATLPGIVGAAWAMPDIHWGYGFPIGGVAAFDPDEGGVVSPGGVGFDINCGVRLLRTGLQAEEVRGRLKETIDALFDVVPAGLGGKGGTGVTDRDLDQILEEGAVWAEEQGLLDADDRRRLETHGRVDGARPDLVSERARVRGRRSLGSLGSGNHFLEVQAVEEVWDEDAAKAFGVASGEAVVMIHTGSRGLGHQIAQEHIQALQGRARFGIRLPDRQLACAPLGSREAEEYMAAMAAGANFAFVNRSLVAARAADALERVFGAGRPTVVYDVCHNIAKMEEHVVEGRRKLLCVHRKGATRAFGPDHPELPQAFAGVGQPVLVPGDMGRQSFLLAGRGTGPGSRAEGPFASCCHGAGRRMSRTEAKRGVSGGSVVQELWDRQGILVRATSPKVAAEEAPQAYKDVGQVVGAVERAGLAARVARVRPLGVVKG